MSQDPGASDGASEGATEQAAEQTAEQAGAGGLPEQVRHRLVALASEALGQLSAGELPASLRPFARFAAARRAKLAATPLATALENDAAFRARVGEVLSKRLPDLVEALRAGQPPAAADPHEVATAAYLLRPDGWERIVADITRRLEEETAAHAADREAEAVDRLKGQLADVRAELRGVRDKHRAELATVKEENQTLRQTLRATRDRLRAAEQEAERLEGARAEAEERADQATARAETELRRLRGRLAEAEAATEASKRASREGRDLATVRLRLLVDTLVEATQGIRRELALPPVDGEDTRPADFIEAVVPGEQGTSSRGREDAAYAANLLALPRLHLVVDGYNVTKTAWAHLPLENQRTRLVAALGDLAARTGAEVTCVFDGADLESPPPVSAPRGVRVRFSPAGITADEVIRRIAAAEPSGRPVAVVSSDREVADGVRRSGARPIGAEAFLRQLPR